MLYKTVGFAAASAVCALMVGCANTTTGKMVEPLEVMPAEVCIIQNPKVTIGEAIPSLQSAFQRRGIKTTVVRDAASCTVSTVLPSLSVLTVPVVPSAV